MGDFDFCSFKHDLTQLKIGETVDHDKSSSTFVSRQKTPTLSVTPIDSQGCPVGVCLGNTMLYPPFSGGDAAEKTRSKNWKMIVGVPDGEYATSIKSAIDGMCADLSHGKGVCKEFVGKTFTKLPFERSTSGDGWQLTVSVPPAGIFIWVNDEQGNPCPDDKFEELAAEYSPAPLDMHEVQDLVRGSEEVFCKFAVVPTTWEMMISGAKTCGIGFTVRQAVLFAPPTEKTNAFTTQKILTFQQQLSAVSPGTERVSGRYIGWPLYDKNNFGLRKTVLSAVALSNSDPEKYRVAEPTKESIELLVFRGPNRCSLSCYSEEVARRVPAEPQPRLTLGNAHTLYVDLAYINNKPREDGSVVELDKDGNLQFDFGGRPNLLRSMRAFEDDLMDSLYTNRKKLLSCDVDFVDKLHGGQVVRKTVTPAQAAALKKAAFGVEDEDTNPAGKRVSFIKDKTSIDKNDSSVAHREARMKMILTDRTARFFEQPDGTRVHEADFDLEQYKDTGPINFDLVEATVAHSVYVCTDPTRTLCDKNCLKYVGVKLNVRHVVFKLRSSSGAETHANVMTQADEVVTKSGKRLKRGATPFGDAKRARSSASEPRSDAANDQDVDDFLQ